MIELHWVVGGLVTGLVLSTVFIPPTRIEKRVPTPTDPSTVYTTDTGCVRLTPVEVPCTTEPESFNLLASFK
uniref:Uncharacterized protein n=1 Tax=viral metagenome TaxID=1070528 RepID=A0A6C0M4R0_9ZZZZ